MSEEKFDTNVAEEIANATQETETTEKSSKYEKALDWAKDHKVTVIAGGVGALIGSVFVGAKAFSKTNTVEVEKAPDPTIMDKYDRIPVEEHSYTDYKYVLKPEYQDE